MPGVVDNESQLQSPPRRTGVAPERAVNLDLYTKPVAAPSDCHPTDCTATDCDECVTHRRSLFAAAACVMVGASAHASERSSRKKLGAQALHWGVLLVGILFSLPIVMPTLTPAARDWITMHLLSTPGNWAVWAMGLVATGLFGVGFVSRLGRERVRGGCAMLRRLGPAAVLGVAWSTLPSLAGVMLVLNMEPIRAALIGVGDPASVATGMSIYLVGFVLLAGFGCLPTVSQALLAGYAFGVPVGLALALAGFGGASLVGYAVVGRVARRRVEQEIANKPKALLIRDALLRASPARALLIVTLVRISPSSPFALTNLLLASIGVSRRVFFVGTLVGMFPRTLAAVVIGQQFTGWNGGIDKPRWLIVAGIVAIIALVIVVSKVAASALMRVARETNEVGDLSLDGAPA